MLSRPKLTYAALVSLGAIAMSAPAAAQDSPWSGFYAGVNAGVTWSDSGGDATLSTTGTAPVASPPINPPTDIPIISRATHFDSEHHTGFTGGVEAGYNYVMDGGLLLGIETDINVYDITGDKARSVTTPPIATPTAHTYTSSQTVDTDFIWTLRPRIGYAMDNFLVFASGGLALTTTQYKASLVDSRTPTQAVEFSRESKTKTGWTIGAGAAYAFTPQLSLKGEYLYQDFGDTDFHATSANGFLQYDAVFTLKSHLFRAGIDYRF